MKLIGLILTVVICGSVTVLSQNLESKESTASDSRIVNTMIHSIGLENNLLGDSPDRNVLIYLPPGYDDSKDTYYPVVYLLHGWQSDATYYFGGWLSLKPILDKLINKGAISPMILVSSDSKNKYLGSFYTNSSITGQWEDFIVKDLVQFVDSTFRTLPQVESRGIAGHSMGGYGTIKLAMRNPNLFGIAYALSPAVTVFEDVTLGTVKPGLIEAVNSESFDGLTWQAQTNIAQAAAYAPNPSSLPYYGDFPVTADGELVDSTWQKWLEHDPYTMLSTYKDSLLKLQAIKFDCGTNDNELYDANVHFSQALTDHGVDHVFETYIGDHINKIPERIEEKMLPFLSANLSFELLKIQEASDFDRIIVYPNPANKNFTIEAVFPDKYGIELISLNGQLMLSKEMEGTTHQIDLSPFQSGVYFITIRSKDFVTTRKIIKL